jgi:hypothetical protein
MTAPEFLKDRDTAFKWAGEIEDYETEWSGYISLARVSASGGTGAWFLAGETASAWDWYTYGWNPGTGSIFSYMTGIHSGLSHTWTAYNSASGASATAFGSASALISLKTMIRINSDQRATSLTQLYTASSYYVISARLITNSAGGAPTASGQRFVQVFYLRVEES